MCEQWFTTKDLLLKILTSTVSQLRSEFKSHFNGSNRKSKKLDLQLFLLKELSTVQDSNNPDVLSLDSIFLKKLLKMNVVQTKLECQKLGLRRDKKKAELQMFILERKSRNASREEQQRSTQDHKVNQLDVHKSSHKQNLAGVTGNSRIRKRKKRLRKSNPDKPCAPYEKKIEKFYDAQYREVFLPYSIHFLNTVKTMDQRPGPYHEIEFPKISDLWEDDLFSDHERYQEILCEEDYALYVNRNKN